MANRYEIILKPAAVRDLDGLKNYHTAAVLDAVEKHLRYEPARESKSRIKKLRGSPPADYRLRVEPHRVFYTIDADTMTVNILRVLHKDQTGAYLQEGAQKGEPST